MTPEIILDTSALVALALGEPGAAKVEKYLRGGRSAMHEANVSELCLALPRKRPAHFDPEIVRTWVERSGIHVVSGFSPRLGALAAKIRLRNKALSLGDGVAMATARLLGVPVLAADSAFAADFLYAKAELIR